MYKIFIDGKAGTTGLRIYERLSLRNDIELLSLSEEYRKDKQARKQMLNSCDIAFLCLPDDAAREAVSLIDNKNVTIIDTSTAHRTLDNWAYGFPELSKEFEQKIKSSNKIAVPGCYASGFISLIYPLIENGLIKKGNGIVCHAVSGFSGAGKNGIAQYNDESRDVSLNAPRQYALTQQHKHIKEMKIISGLENEPIFCPYVCDYYSGMTVTIPLFKNDLNKSYKSEDIKNLYKTLYNNNIVKYCDIIDKNGFISGNRISDKDTMEITVAGNDERILLISSFNNLGKGSSGAAIECMNIKLGISPLMGLEL